MITFFILSFLATLLIFVSLTFMTGIGKVYDTVKENINGADILFIINDNEDLVDKAKDNSKFILDKMLRSSITDTDYRIEFV